MRLYESGSSSEGQCSNHVCEGYCVAESCASNFQSCTSAPLFHAVLHMTLGLLSTRISGRFGFS
jgi:hypothetical protein